MKNILLILFAILSFVAVYMINSEINFSKQNEKFKANLAFKFVISITILCMILLAVYAIL